MNTRDWKWLEVVMMMDDDIREKLHAELAPCDEDTFLRAYESAHLQKYGEKFEPARWWWDYTTEE